MLLFQLKIQLEGVEDPTVWRTILVQPNIMLDELHYVLQGSMGWLNTHKHEYTVGTDIIGIPVPPKNEDDFLDDKEEIQDERDVALMECIRREGDQMTYKYDVWTHTITLVEVKSASDEELNPIVLTGEGTCPPEDCGGLWGYEELKAILDNPRHDDHEEMNELHGDDFDPDDFDLELLNARIRTLYR